MRNLLTIAAALCVTAGPGLAQASPEPAAADSSAADTVPAQGIVMPSGSPLRLASIKRGNELAATFTGRVEVSGTYEIELYGKDIYARLWPDAKSRALLPYWDGREAVDELYISNALEFARSVVSKEELAKLKAGRLPLIRGQATIVADEYETNVECDASHFSARFVSVVRNVEVAGEIGSGGEC